MAEMLLINPRRRRKARHTSAKRSARRVSRRRRNPAPALALHSPVRRRRRNPVHARRVHRRRRNPIGGRSGGSGMSIATMLKQALIGGLGATAFDVLWGKVNPMLPASMQTSQTGIGTGDAVKAAATVLLGRALRKATRGMSQQVALFALASQVRDIATVMLPASMSVAGLGYAVPGRVVSGNARIGPNQSMVRNVSPLLNRYARAGATPLLNAAAPGQPSAFRTHHSSDTALREGVRYR